VAECEPLSFGKARFSNFQLFQIFALDQEFLQNFWFDKVKAIHIDTLQERRVQVAIQKLVNKRSS